MFLTAMRHNEAKALAIVFVAVCLGANALPPVRGQALLFSGTMAYEHVLSQMRFGPRVPGSESITRAADYISDRLKASGMLVTTQDFRYQNLLLGKELAGRNIIGTFGKGEKAVVIGAHYDSRPLADGPNSSDKTKPVPGANDGASGVAIQLELARILASLAPNRKIVLVFFDAEDSGSSTSLNGWIVGSTHFVENLPTQERRMIEFAVVIDMVGDADLNIYREGNSDKNVVDRIWHEAAKLGYRQFINASRYTILDDHLPFLNAGIPAADIIDFDYPYWHTPNDTEDKVALASLEAVGRTIESVLRNFDAKRLPTEASGQDQVPVTWVVVISFAFAVALIFLIRRRRRAGRS